MTILKAIILGIVQGLTEFLPISSSGHLVLAQSFLNVTEPPLFFDIMLHLGTLIAIVIAFRKDIWDILLSIFGRSLHNPHEAKESGRWFLCLIVIGSLPTAIIALSFEKFIEEAFDNPLLVSIMLIVTGVVLWLSGRFNPAGRPYRRMNITRALIVGTAQGISAIPGISRSGATISTALMTGVSGEESARYSLLLSVPAVLGACVLKSRDIGGVDISVWAIVVGTLTAFFVGYIAIRFLLRVLRRGHFSKFAYYCFCVGIIGIIGSLIR